MEQKTLLVVDDNEEIRDALSEYLTRSGFIVHLAEDGDAMWQCLAKHDVNLIILDIMLPGDDGLTLCSKIRQTSHVPIIMLTAVTDEIDRIAGLEIGADDYITKTFSPRELLARIKALLRRSQFTSTIPLNRKLRFLDWTFDTVKRQLSHIDGNAIKLSGSDYSLLLMMLQNPNKLLSRDDIAQCIWGRDADPFERGIDVQMSRLRKHFNDVDRSLIVTVRNKGYMLAVDAISEE
ncbi:DNA-binding response regulator [Photobacterium jeanii]|uniref:DNA-binding response regulator n=1 Tax=Photobacterium jeanii TaxID=858640 RepID=A0A178KPU3_9GAMM|nr:response regulator transcription factor [Photobacterium jeanii]OAN18774.1 DNA-binding response regulator [Photobacterium jeanii]PST92819.1 DNA-binding response regulator [Photobacterium jeanii]